MIECFRQVEFDKIWTVEKWCVDMYVRQWRE